MPKLRREEEWARQMIERPLGVPVVQHDDGSRRGMHDLDIIFPDGQYGAVEATAAADAVSIELWNLMNGGGRWIEDSLAGGWMVSVHPNARARRLRQELPHLLGHLERLGVAELRTRHRGGGLDEVARDLGIANAGQSATSFPGSIYITLQLPSERMGGFVADTGDALAEWLGEFLSEPGQHDVLAKLANSGADEGTPLSSSLGSRRRRSQSATFSCARVRPCRWCPQSCQRRCLMCWR